MSICQPARHTRFSRSVRSAVWLVPLAAWLLVSTPVVAVEGILAGAADPAIIAAPDGKPGYYVFATGKGCAIWYSRDLAAWSKVGTVFDRSVPGWAKEMVPKTRGIWAPDISHFGGKYHLYYSVSSFGKQRSVIGLATNVTIDPADPDYAWEDQGLVIESSPETTNFNAIDPALFVDHDGQPYLFWGSYWTGLKMLRIDAATGKPEKYGNPVEAIAARTPNTDQTAIEAPYVMFHDGYYYLFVSYDFCCAQEKSTYNVTVGRSRKVTGPYVDFHGTPMTDGGATLVLASHDRWAGPGHNSVLSTNDGDYLVHHTYDTENLHAQRILQVRPMVWDADGWPLAGEPISVAGRDEAVATESLVGTWRHTVNYRHGSTIRLKANGTIDHKPKRVALWDRDENTLRLRWQADEAPDGYWVDTVRLADDGRSYVGRNQHGMVIRGVRE